MGPCSLGRSVLGEGKGVRPIGLLVGCGCFLLATEQAELIKGHTS